MQSSWIALSARYPQAFDEQFHLGIIQVYAHHWLPFLRSQPLSADPYGAVTRDPSFLYHYLMSFPYRIIELFTHDQTIQVILLRFINIGLYVFGLLLFSRVLRRTGLSSRCVNTCLFVMTFIPVAPQLAGQINYDNLLIPLTAWTCLLTFGIIDQVQEKRFKIQTLLGLATICLLSSMVKYEFLPIFLAVIIFLVVFAWHQLKGNWRRASRRALKDWKVGGLSKWFILAAFVAAFALFAERDLGNVIMYHTVIPDCSQVLTLQQCSAYGVWVHDYATHHAVIDYDAHVNPNPIKYLIEWVYWLWYRLFFAINGPSDGFRNWPPLPLPAGAFAVVVAGSAVAIVLKGRKVFSGKPYLKLLGMIVIIYALTLFGAGYLKYLDTGVLELMNGRYLFPILLPGAAVAMPALAELWKDWPTNFRYGVVLLLLICFLEGGGVFTFIARSDASWYWKNDTVVRINNDARDVLEPLLFDGSRYYSGSHWLFN